jgi:hypothetical protein
MSEPKKNLGGRPRVYASNAERQKAYRGRVRRGATLLEQQRNKRKKRIKAALAAYWDSVLTTPALRNRAEQKRKKARLKRRTK